MFTEAVEGAAIDFRVWKGNSKSDKIQDTNLHTYLPFDARLGAEIAKLLDNSMHAPHHLPTRHVPSPTVEP